MKKNQKKSKVEERKSVANQCDYCRANGKCGRAMFDNYGTTCQGRSCEAWQCDAEGEVEEVKVEGEGEQRKFISRCDGMRKDGTCGNGYCDNHNKKCRGAKCPERFSHYEGETSAVTVVEPSGGAVGMTDQDVAAGITRQLQVIEDAEKNAQLERVKLGVVLIRWEQYLGDGRGRGAGKGLKGWLEANVPKLGYETAKSYKDQAKKAVEMLGGGAKAQAVLLDEPTVTQPDGEVIEIEADYVAKRDKIFEDVKSRRQLEQTYFKFMASEGKGKRGRKEGSKAAQVAEEVRKAKTAAEKAADAEHEMRELIGALGAFLTRGGKVQMLSDAAKSDFHRSLVDYAEVLAEMI